MINNPRALMAAGVTVGSALAYGIYRRYRSTFTAEAPPTERFYTLNGIRVTAGQAQPLDYQDVDGIKLTRVGPDRL